MPQLAHEPAHVLQPLVGRRALLDLLDDRCSHNDAICASAREAGCDARFFRAVDAESHDDRAVELLAQRLGRLAGRRKLGGDGTRDARHRDEIDETPTGTRRRLGRALDGGKASRYRLSAPRRNHRKPVGHGGLSQACSFLRREVDQEKTIDSGCGGALDDAGFTRHEHGVVVREEHERCVAGCANGGRHVNHAIECRSGCDGALAGSRDRRAVGGGIAEGHAELQHVRAGFECREREAGGFFERRVADA